MNSRFLKIAYTMATALLLAACSQDEMTEQDLGLPEGKYSLEIVSVAMSVESSEQPWEARVPQTRVVENTDGKISHWTDGDKIGVQIGHNTETGLYIVNVDPDGNVTSLTPETPVYWKSTTSLQTVKAWYPATDESVNLTNQDSDLAYVLAGTGSGDYKSAVSLTFTHALAKVRVVFSDESTADLTNASVSILAPTTCTVNKGEVTEGNTTAYIPMHKATYNSYEANVTPNLLLKNDAFQLVVGGKTVNCSTTEVQTQAGQLHIITLTVNEKYTEVNVSNISQTEYTVSGNVHLKGDGTLQNLKLIVNDGAKLILENVAIQPETQDAPITCSGNATIILNENNSVSGYGSQGVFVSGGKTLVIKGNGKLEVVGAIGATDNSNITINSGSITVRTTSGCAGIGSAGSGLTCGVITINGGTIEAQGGSYSAGIGGSDSGNCGDIIITGGSIRANGGMTAPGIGSGDNSACGNITISGTNTVVYAKKGDPFASSIGTNNVNGSCGTVTIGLECIVVQE